MSLRVMLPSKAKVGDTVQFAFPNGQGKSISGFDVVINGEKISDATFTTSRSKGAHGANYIYNVTKPGTYQFEITPIDPAGDRGESRFNTLEVDVPGLY